MEIWKPIPKFEGCYEASNQGRIKSLERTVNRRGNTTRIVPGIILAPIVNDKGYVVVNLNKDGRKSRKRVSIIIASLFVDNPDNLPEVNHDDGNKLNNAANNLSWTDRSGNMQHAYRTGLKASPTGYTHAQRAASSQSIY